MSPERRVEPRSVRLLVDEDFPRSLSDELAGKGYPVNYGRKGCKDYELIEQARREARAILTLDKDFKHTGYGVENTPYGAVFIKSGSRQSPQTARMILGRFCEWCFCKIGMQQGFLSWAIIEVTQTHCSIYRQSHASPQIINFQSN